MDVFLLSKNLERKINISKLSYEEILDIYNINGDKTEIELSGFRQLLWENYFTYYKLDNRQEFYNFILRHNVVPIINATRSEYNYVNELKLDNTIRAIYNFYAWCKSDIGQKDIQKVFVHKNSVVEILGFTSNIDTFIDSLMHKRELDDVNPIVKWNSPNPVFKLPMHNGKVEMLETEFDDEYIEFNRDSFINFIKKYYNASTEEDIVKYAKEYTKRAADTLSNRCIHLQYRRKRDVKTLYETYMDSKSVNNHNYECKICGFECICDHEIDLYVKKKDMTEVVSNYGIDEGSFIYCIYCNRMIKRSYNQSVELFNKDREMIYTFNDSILHNKDEIFRTIKNIAYELVDNYNSNILMIIFKFLESSLKQKYISIEGNESLINKYLHYKLAVVNYTIAVISIQTYMRRYELKDFKRDGTQKDLLRAINFMITKLMHYYKNDINIIDNSLNERKFMYSETFIALQYYKDIYINHKPGTLKIPKPTLTQDMCKTEYEKTTNLPKLFMCFEMFKSISKEKLDQIRKRFEIDWKSSDIKPRFMPQTHIMHKIEDRSLTYYNTKHFCEDGKLHDWSSLVYLYNSKRTISMQEFNKIKSNILEDINNFIDNIKNINLHHTAVCSHCKVKQDDVILNNKSLKNIKSVVDAEIKKMTLFKALTLFTLVDFKGNLHDFDDHEKCKTCGYTIHQVYHPDKKYKELALKSYETVMKSFEEYINEQPDVETISLLSKTKFVQVSSDTLMHRMSENVDDVKYFFGFYKSFLNSMKIPLLYKKYMVFKLTDYFRSYKVNIQRDDNPNIEYNNIIKHFEKEKDLKILYSAIKYIIDMYQSYKNTKQLDDRIDSIIAEKRRLFMTMSMEDKIKHGLLEKDFDEQEIFFYKMFNIIGKYSLDKEEIKRNRYPDYGTFYEHVDFDDDMLGFEH